MSRVLQKSILLISLSMNVGCNITLFASEIDRVEVEEQAVNTQDDSEYVLQQNTQALSENHDSVNEQLNTDSTDRYVIDTEVFGTVYDSKKVYTADIMIANYTEYDLYPFIENKVGFRYNKMPFTVEKNNQMLIPTVFTAELPGHIPNNHLADTKQFKIILSKDDETGSWGCFGKKFAVQIDAYFSQQIGLQTVHCYTTFQENSFYANKKATCVATLGAKNHINIMIELHE